MKKVLLSFALVLLAASSVNAQIVRADELEKYAMERYGDNWVDAAANLASQLTLDKNNALTYVQVIEAPGKTKEDLYVLLNYWYTSTFNDANCVINQNDKELGSIIAQGYVANIAQHSGGMNSYNVSIQPIIKCDIKDEKVRVTYTVPYYTVVKDVGGGMVVNPSYAALKAVSGGIKGGLSGTPATHSDESWSLNSCYPFAEKDKHQKTSCKALVMSHAYSNVVMDKVEECIKNGVVGNEDDDW
ncbi:MAG: DUF4468 domain-containing protein [Prevotella sp.]|nr:DUF4468 domain-containing protein [Prevotella sp.]